MAIRIAQNASVSDAAKLSDNTLVWDFAQVRENAVVGENSIIGSYAYIDANVKVGANCKIQNRALIYDPAIIHNGVFIGPSAILTNDKNPRALRESGEIKKLEDWKKDGVEVFEGASIGAGAICIAPIKIGRWALVGAGSVVTKNVRDFALVLGNPAHQVGWVGPAGAPLKKISDGIFECPVTLSKYIEKENELREYFV
jgi:acetyltransferase-like isoleucine patch superfamily enzyme